MGPSTEPWGTPYMSCGGDEDELLTEVDWHLSERYEWNHWSAVDWMPKNRVQAGEENLVVNSIKSGRKIQQKKNRNVVTVQSGEYRLQYVTKRSQCCILLDRLTERDCWGCFLGDGREVCGERHFQEFWTESPNVHYKFHVCGAYTWGGGDSSVVRAPDSWLKGRGFESLLERRENFLLQGRLSVLTLISVSVPPPCYHSST